MLMNLPHILQYMTYLSPCIYINLSIEPLYNLILLELLGKIITDFTFHVVFTITNLLFKLFEAPCWIYSLHAGTASHGTLRVFSALISEQGWAFS